MTLLRSQTLGLGSILLVRTLNYIFYLITSGNSWESERTSFACRLDIGLDFLTQPQVGFNGVTQFNILLISFTFFEGLVKYI